MPSGSDVSSASASVGDANDVDPAIQSLSDSDVYDHREEVEAFQGSVAPGRWVSERFEQCHEPDLIFIMGICCCAVASSSLAGYLWSGPGRVFISASAISAIAWLASVSIGFPSVSVRMAMRYLFSVGWLLSVGLFWFEVFNGTLVRLGPDEGDRMIPLACFWVLAMIVPHVLDLFTWHLVLFYVHAFFLLLTSPHWWVPTLFAMLLGNAAGFAAARMLQVVQQGQKQLDSVTNELARMQKHTTALETARREALVASKRSAPRQSSVRFRQPHASRGVPTPVPEESRGNSQ